MAYHLATDSDRFDSTEDDTANTININQKRQAASDGKPSLLRHFSNIISGPESIFQKRGKAEKQFRRFMDQTDGL